jgi:hypothetical protein
MRQISLKTKVVLPVTLMIVAAVMLALIIVNQVVRRQVTTSISHDIEKSRLVFQELEMMERGLLFDQGLVAASAPHLKAALDTEDSTTVQNVTDRFFQTLGSDVLIVTDREHQILAHHGIHLGGPGLAPDSLFAMHKASATGYVGRIPLQDNFYDAVFLPVNTQDASFGHYLLGNVFKSHWGRISLHAQRTDSPIYAWPLA